MIIWYLFSVEPQVLDYQTQQMKLFPAISAAYALHFTAENFGEIFNEVQQSVVSGDVSRLAEVFYTKSLVIEHSCHLDISTSLL